MPNYHRHYLDLPVFLTVVTHQRRPWLVTEAERLRAAMRAVKVLHPYTHLAHAVLPDHLHWLIKPAPGTNFSAVVTALKRRLSFELKTDGQAGPFWQPRFYDHLIRDADDLQRHLDYIHYNPVKHGHAPSPAAWPHSSFAEWQKRGAYPPGWGDSVEPEGVRGMALE